MLNCFIGLVARLTDNTLYMLVLPLISFCSSVCACLKVFRCFYTMFIVEIVLKVLIYAVYTCINVK